PSPWLRKPPPHTEKRCLLDAPPNPALNKVILPLSDDRREFILIDSSSWLTGWLRAPEPSNGKHIWVCMGVGPTSTARIAILWDSHIPVKWLAVVYLRLMGFCLLQDSAVLNASSVCVTYLAYI